MLALHQPGLQTTLCPMVEEGEGGHERRWLDQASTRPWYPGPQGEEGGWVVKAGDQGPPALPQPC